MYFSLEPGRAKNAVMRAGLGSVLKNPAFEDLKYTFKKIYSKIYVIPLKRQVNQLKFAKLENRIVSFILILYLVLKYFSTIFILFWHRFDATIFCEVNRKKTLNL